VTAPGNKREKCAKIGTMSPTTISPKNKAEELKDENTFHVTLWLTFKSTLKSQSLLFVILPFSLLTEQFLLCNQNFKDHLGMFKKFRLQGALGIWQQLFLLLPVISLQP